MFINFSNDGYKLAIGISVGVGVLSATAGLAYIYAQKLRNTPPKRWRRVGEITDIMVYPIKSCAPIKRTTMKCGKIGLADGYLRDRCFMVTELDGKFITARAYPIMLQIQPTIFDDKMQLTAPAMPSIEIDFTELNRLSMIGKKSAKVWADYVDVIDCGDAVAEWISRIILEKDDGLRLVWYPNEYPTRNCSIRQPKHKKLTPDDSGALHDLTGYMMINEGSIGELNSRLDHVVQPQQFRPNFVIRGPQAFEEDHWQWVKIGSDNIFRNIKYCTRCIFTNINPKTSKRNEQFQPFKTLQAYRRILPGDSPVMGIHIGARKMGTVSVGDAVYVESNGL